jgi:hypothetical protein
MTATSGSARPEERDPVRRPGPAFTGAHPCGRRPLSLTGTRRSGVSGSRPEA